MDWRFIFEFLNLSEAFISKYHDYQNGDYWDEISLNQKLSENFIREFQNEVDWCSISREQILSEDFIEEFKDQVDWLRISIGQKLSDKFLKKFSNKIKWNYYFNNQEASFEIIKKFILKSGFHTTNDFKTRHLSQLHLNEIEKILVLKHMFVY